MSVVDERADVLDRFSMALYTVPEAARYLDVPTSTLSLWAHGYRNRPPGRREVVGAPILTTVPRRVVRLPINTFIGLAEGVVLTAIRRSGVPMQRIRPALEQFDTQIGLSHALASRRLYTDGAEGLFDYAEATDDPHLVRAARGLVVVRNGQRVFNEVVAAYLRRLEFDDRGYVRLIRLPAYEVAEIVVDPVRIATRSAA